MLGLLGHGAAAQRFLETADADERLTLVALAEAGIALDAIRQRNQAVLIVNELGKAMRK